MTTSTNDANPSPRLLTLKAAAGYLSIGIWKLRRLIWAGELPSVQDGKGGRVLVDRVDLDKWVEAHKN